jgi:hypothetical protein
VPLEDLVKHDAIEEAAEADAEHEAGGHHGTPSNDDRHRALRSAVRGAPSLRSVWRRIALTTSTATANGSATHHR